MTREEKIRKIQEILEVKVDGDWGPKSQAALDSLTKNKKVNQVKASSFADPADIASFKICKAKGGTDQECFKVGDNGIGKWGDDTTVNVPMCALPPEDWQSLQNPRGAKVLVKANGKQVICELRDTMPRKANIKNGAGIDLNPAAVKALGLNPPIMISATWEFI